jgi:drug/metabolite transporter (DMT)-like permease
MQLERNRWTGKVLKLFLRNIGPIVLLAGLILGSIGFLLAGWNGFVNGATWGVVLGLVAAPFMAMVILAKYWGGYSERYGSWWIDEESKNKG